MQGKRKLEPSACSHQHADHCLQGQQGTALEGVNTFVKKLCVFSSASQIFIHEFAALSSGMRTSNLMNVSDGVIKY